MLHKGLTVIATKSYNTYHFKRVSMAQIKTISTIKRNESRKLQMLVKRNEEALLLYVLPLSGRPTLTSLMRFTLFDWIRKQFGLTPELFAKIKDKDADCLLAERALIIKQENERLRSDNRKFKRMLKREGYDPSAVVQLEEYYNE